MFLLTSNHALKNKVVFIVSFYFHFVIFFSETNLFNFDKNAGNCIQNFFSLKNDLSVRDPVGEGGNQVCQFISA